MEQKDQESNVDLTEYDQVNQVMNELVGDIEDSLTEEEKFRKIYERIAFYLMYDYSDSCDNESDEKTCAQKALLSGKTNCEGFACVLKEVCSEKGIEARIVRGPVDLIKNKKSYLYKKSKAILFKDDNSIIVRENHVWNKVKINGVWYNCDISWDRQDILNKKAPKYALLSDELYRKLGRPTVENSETPCTKNIIGTDKNKFFEGLNPCDNLVANHKVMEFESTIDENGDLRQLPALSGAFPWSTLWYNLKKLARFSRGRAIEAYYHIKYKINPDAQINDRPTEEFKIVKNGKVGE
ncbi:MAG: transglutaminase domain-containing protein [Clostridia bacterium]|nr:transglutaminase domain-containing protein [Clostridia bacterium]